MVTFGIFTYLCIRQAALGHVRASSHFARLHSLCIRQAALGQLRASSFAARLHCLCKCCFVAASIHGR